MLLILWSCFRILFPDFGFCSKHAFDIKSCSIVIILLSFKVLAIRFVKGKWMFWNSWRAWKNFLLAPEDIDILFWPSFCDCIHEKFTFFVIKRVGGLCQSLIFCCLYKNSNRYLLTFWTLKGGHLVEIEDWDLCHRRRECSLWITCIYATWYVCFGNFLSTFF